MKRKVRINKLPEGYHMMPDGTIMQDSAHKMQQGGSVKNLSPIDRNYANLEAERGELAMADLAGDGNMGLYAIGGERHSNGGTPLNLNPGSFIFSDTRKMKIKDPEFLAKYGKSKSVTPAKLAKPFLKLNDYTATMYDDNADDIQKRTADSMIKNYKNKAAEIAFYQESMKGFPQGIPAIAQDYAESVMGAAQMAYGGYVPKAQGGLTLYPGGKTKAGTTTPTGQSNRFNRNPEYLKQWEEKIPGVVNMSNTQAQSAIYDYMLSQPDGPDVVRNMWGTYGLTAKGKENPSLLSKYDKGVMNPADLSEEDLRELKSAYADSFFGARQLDPLYKAPVEEPAAPEETPPAPPAPQETPAVPSLTPAKPNKTYPFQQDVNLERTNAINQLSERRRFAWAPQLGFMPADPTYMDDTRQQGQIAGAARSMANAIGAFAGPQTLGSRMSQIAGQAGEQSADIAAKLQAGNTGIGNQFETYNSQMANEMNLRNIANQMGAYDKNIKTQEVFDEKMRAYRTRGTALKNAKETNKAKAQLLNQMFPDFQINTTPGSYGNVIANPEVLRAIQDPANFKNMSEAQKKARQESIDEVFRLVPVEYDKEGKDMNVRERAALLAPILKQTSADTPNPFASYMEYLKMFAQ
jgi:hypothetical protein